MCVCVDIDVFVCIHKEHEFMRDGVREELYQVGWVEVIYNAYI